MSYALPGVRYGLRRALGQSDPALSLPQITNGGAVALGAQSVLNDPSAMNGLNPLSGFPTLSPFSIINLNMLSGVFSNVLAQPLESAASSLIAELPDSLVSTIADVVGDVVDIVPVIGPIFKAIFDILSGMFGGETAYGGSADETRDCQYFMSWFQVQGSGAEYENCQTCPTDLFYPSISFTSSHCSSDGTWCPKPLVLSHLASGLNNLNYYPGPAPCDPAAAAGDSYWSTCCANFRAYQDAYPWNIAVWGDPESVSYPTPPRTFQDIYAMRMPPNWPPASATSSTWNWRPAIGQALMLLTEGAVIDAFEITDGASRLAFASWSDKAYDNARAGFTSYLNAQERTAEAAWWSKYGGIPPARRAQFRALRRGIQASNAHYGRSDGGVSLWPVYMDLLLDSYDRGQLNPEFIGYMLTYQYVQGAFQTEDCQLADQNGNMVAPNKEGRLMNQNLFGNGFMVNGDPGNTISVCAQSVQGMVTKLLDQWRINTQDPETQVGADKLAGYAAQAKAIGSGQGTGRKMMAVPPGGLMVSIGPLPKPVVKVHQSAAVLGAATAAAVIYLFL